MQDKLLPLWATVVVLMDSLQCYILVPPFANLLSFASLPSSSASSSLCFLMSIGISCVLHAQPVISIPFWLPWILAGLGGVPIFVFLHKVSPSAYPQKNRGEHELRKRTNTLIASVVVLLAMVVYPLTTTLVWILTLWQLLWYVECSIDKNLLLEFSELVVVATVHVVTNNCWDVDWLNVTSLKWSATPTISLCMVSSSKQSWVIVEGLLLKGLLYL